MLVNLTSGLLVWLKYTNFNLLFRNNEATTHPTLYVEHCAGGPAAVYSTLDFWWLAATADGIARKGEGCAAITNGGRFIPEQSPRSYITGSHRHTPAPGEWQSGTTRPAAAARFPASDTIKRPAAPARQLSPLFLSLPPLRFWALHCPERALMPIVRTGFL